MQGSSIETSYPARSLVRLSWGLMLVVLGLMLRYFLPNLIGFAGGMVGAAPKVLVWADAIGLLGNLAGLAGLLLIVAVMTPARAGWIVAVAGWALLVLVIVETADKLASSPFIQRQLLWPYSGYVVLARSFVGLLFFVSISHAFALAGLNRRFILAAVLYAAALVVDVLTAGAAFRINLLPPADLYGLVYVALWLYVLRLVWRTWRKAGLVLAKHCTRCGYSHKGTESAICPQCGTPSWVEVPGGLLPPMQSGK